MHSSLISKIDKARKYAEESTRIAFKNYTLTFQGNHGTHEINYNMGDWECSCPFFKSRSTCSHIMATERILEAMLPKDGKYSGYTTR